MMEQIKLDSRYKDVNTVYHRINDTCGILTSDGAFTRSILAKGGEEIQAIDFEGGPMISVGDILFNKKVKNIKMVYYVELE